jgi:hypothetical protein
MTNTIVHYEGAASLEVAGGKVKLSRLIIKIGLDMHARVRSGDAVRSPAAQAGAAFVPI